MILSSRLTYQLKLDFDKLATLIGSKSGNSARTTWSNIRKKLAVSAAAIGSPAGDKAAGDATGAPHTPTQTKAAAASKTPKIPKSSSKKTKDSKKSEATVTDSDKEATKTPEPTLANGETNDDAPMEDVDADTTSDAEANGDGGAETTEATTTDVAVDDKGKGKESAEPVTPAADEITGAATATTAKKPKPKPKPKAIKTEVATPRGDTKTPGDNPTDAGETTPKTPGSASARSVLGRVRPTRMLKLALQLVKSQVTMQRRRSLPRSSASSSQESCQERAC